MSEEEGGERNEPATQKRIRQAREQGQVALSREAVGMAGLLASTATAAALMPGQVQYLLAAMRGTLERSHDLAPGVAAAEWGWLFFGMLWPVAAAAVLGATLATLAQTRGTISVGQLTPSLNKLSPMAGLGRLFGQDALLEFGRTCLKLCVVGGALWMVAGDLSGLAASMDLPPGALLGAAASGALRLLGATLVAFVLLAGADVLLVRARHLARLR